VCMEEHLFPANLRRAADVEYHALTSGRPVYIALDKSFHSLC
jgi:hypothetical protein